MNYKTIAICMILFFFSIGIVSAGSSSWTFQVIGDGQFYVMKNGAFDSFAIEGIPFSTTFNTGDQITLKSQAMDGSIFVKICDIPTTECRPDSFYSDTITAESGSYIMEATFEKVLIATPSPIPSPEPTSTPTPTQTPTTSPTPTPSPTPSPTPTPEPTTVPSPKLAAMIAEKAIATPTPTQTPIPASPEYGTVFFNSTPKNATIYINGQKLKVGTPTARDFAPGKYQINITQDGYLPFSKLISLKDGDRIPINVSFERIIEDIAPLNETKISSSEPVTFSALPPARNETMTNTDKTPVQTSPDMSNTYIFVSGTCLVIVLVAVFFYMRSKQDNRPFSEQIAEMTKRNPEMPDEIIAEKLGCSLKTVQRNRA